MAGARIQTESVNTQCAEDGFAVTPSDATIFGGKVRALWVGGAGNVAVRMKKSGTLPIFVAVPAGSFLPVGVDKVLSTGTTATSIVALY